MKKTTLFLMFSIGLLALSISAMSQRHYEDKDCGAITAQHKKIAILPFVVSYEYKQTKNMSAEINQKQLEAQAYLLQNRLYAAMLEKSRKFKYNVEIQNIDETNAILQKAQITVEDLPATTKEKIAKILKVDAVIYGIISGKETLTENQAAVIGVLTGGKSIASKELNYDISLFNADSKLLWKYNVTHNGDSFNEMAAAVFNIIARRIPYSERWRKKDEKNNN